MEKSIHPSFHTFLIKVEKDEANESVHQNFHTFEIKVKKIGENETVDETNTTTFKIKVEENEENETADETDTTFEIELEENEVNEPVYETDCKFEIKMEKDEASDSNLMLLSEAKNFQSAKLSQANNSLTDKKNLTDLQEQNIKMETDEYLPDVDSLHTEIKIEQDEIDEEHWIDSAEHKTASETKEETQLDENSESLTYWMSTSDSEEPGLLYCINEYDENPPEDPLRETSNENSDLFSRKRSQTNKGNSYGSERYKSKKAREMGKPYYSIGKCKSTVTGYKIRSARKIQERCTSQKCTKSKIKKCNEIDEATREKIFRRFWENQSWQQKKAYVIDLVERQQPVSFRSGRRQLLRKKNTLRYHLPVNNEKWPVCKKMFLATLNLGESSVLNWVLNSNTYSTPKTVKSSNNTYESLIAKKLMHIKTFLESIPKMPSHYCRDSSEKHYLEMIYTSTRDVYNTFQKYLEYNNIPDCEEGSYDLLVKQMHTMNINLFKSRKEQCDLCFSYDNNNTTKDDYDKHIRERDRVQKEKENDKLNAIAGKVHVFTVDVDGVQLVPALVASSLYFKQKLACHRVTIFNIHTKDVLCYVWHEGEGGMDANNITSCIIDFLENHIENIDSTTPVTFYSDGCSEPNRNVTLSNALFHFANDNNITLYQKYLVNGHAQTECDLVHAAIERRKKNREIQVPANYVQIIQEARNKKPYNVKYVDHTFFKDFTTLDFVTSIRPDGDSGDSDVDDIKALKYTNDSIMFKLSFDDEWQIIPQRLNTSVPKSIRVPPLYTSPVLIPFRKYNDLQSLKNVIYKDYHRFYDELHHENK